MSPAATGANRLTHWSDSLHPDRLGGANRSTSAVTSRGGNARPREAKNVPRPLSLVVYAFSHPENQPLGHSLHSLSWGVPLARRLQVMLPDKKSTAARAARPVRSRLVLMEFPMLFQAIQLIAAAALAASSLLIQTAASAAVAAPSVESTPVAATLDRAISSPHRVDFVALDVPYAPSQWRPRLDRVFHESLTAPDALQPTGSLTWAGVGTVGQEEPFWTPRRGQSGLFEFVDESPNVDLLAARPAPEPPAIVMAAFALTAGAVWTGYRRRKKVTAADDVASEPELA